eukprot:6180673-Pleurochrysis_carterae.AAC.2
MARSRIRSALCGAVTCTPFAFLSHLLLVLRYRLAFAACAVADCARRRARQAHSQPPHVRSAHFPLESMANRPTKAACVSTASV